MNVVITLPEHLIKAIMMGDKFFEIRTKKPLHFDEKKDVVFVVQKGTKMVPLYFTIKHFYHYDYNSYSYNEYLAEKAAVSVEYINNYIKGKVCIYAWVIGCACKVDCPCYLYSELKINNNPQSFIYRDYEWRQIEFTSFEWLAKPKNKYTTLIPEIEYERYMRSHSSALPSTL